MFEQMHSEKFEQESLCLLRRRQPSSGYLLVQPVSAMWSDTSASGKQQSTFPAANAAFVEVKANFSLSVAAPKTSVDVSRKTIRIVFLALD